MANGMLVQVSPGTNVGPNWVQMVANAFTSTPLSPILRPGGSVFIQALPGNTDDIYVGGADIQPANGGAILQARASIVIAIDNPQKISIYSRTIGQGVSCLVVG